MLASQDGKPWQSPLAQGKRSSVCEIEAFRFPSNDPFVDSVKFGIGALARDGPGVIDFIARFEESGVGTDLLHDAGGVPSEDLVLLFFGRTLIRTFTSTGLTEIARTSTNRSRCAATGTGSSISSSADGFSIGSDCWYPTAFIVLFLSNQRWISFAISAQ